MLFGKLTCTRHNTMLVGRQAIRNHFWLFSVLVKQVYTIILHVPPTHGFKELIKQRFWLISGFSVKYMYRYTCGRGTSGYVLGLI